MVTNGPKSVQNWSTIGLGPSLGVKFDKIKKNKLKNLIFFGLLGAKLGGLGGQDGAFEGQVGEMWGQDGASEGQVAEMLGPKWRQSGQHDRRKNR